MRWSYKESFDRGSAFFKGHFAVAVVGAFPSFIFKVYLVAVSLDINFPQFSSIWGFHICGPWRLSQLVSVDFLFRVELFCFNFIHIHPYQSIFIRINPYPSISTHMAFHISFLILEQQKKGFCQTFFWAVFPETFPATKKKRWPRRVFLEAPTSARWRRVGWRLDGL